MGKLLVEKLLRSCPEVSNLYLLIRTKKGKNLHERIHDMCEDPVFERLSVENPKFKEKIIGIAGDICEPNLGISEEDQEKLWNEVNIVFHVAATVTFDEPIKKAVNSNIKAVQSILALTRRMKKLESLMHVSTLYSNCLKKCIEEKFYPPPMDYKKIVNITDVLDEELLTKLTPELLHGYPNTYSFTKAIAEDLLKQEASDLPIAVFRPSIVISTYREPAQGWIDNLYGPTGVTAAASNGLLRCLHTDKKAKANLVPADMCVNALIAAGWENAMQRQKLHENHTESTAQNSEIPIYQYESYRDSPIDWETYMGMTEKYALDYISINAIWHYSLVLIKNKYLFNVAFYLLHILPAYFADFFLKASGKRLRLGKVYVKIRKFCDVISYFSTREWVTESERVQNLCQHMDIKDKELFFCDLKQLDWDDYFKNYFKGIRIYLVKDPLTTQEAALKKGRKLYVLHLAVKYLILGLLLYAIWSIVNILLS